MALRVEAVGLSLSSEAVGGRVRPGSKCAYILWGVRLPVRCPAAFPSRVKYVGFGVSMGVRLFGVCALRLGPRPDRCRWSGSASSLACVRPSKSRVRALQISAAIERPTQNWHDPGESDCLIKTKHCDGRKSVLTQCDFCPVL